MIKDKHVFYCNNSELRVMNFFFLRYSILVGRMSGCLSVAKAGKAGRQASSQQQVIIIYSSQYLVVFSHKSIVNHHQGRQKERKKAGGGGIYLSLGEK